MSKKKRINWDPSIEEGFLGDWNDYKKGELTFETLQKMYGKHTKKAFEDHAYLHRKGKLTKGKPGRPKKEQEELEECIEICNQGPTIWDQLYDFYYFMDIETAYYTVATVGWLILSGTLVTGWF